MVWDDTEELEDREFRLDLRFKGGIEDRRAFDVCPMLPAAPFCTGRVFPFKYTDVLVFALLSLKLPPVALLREAELLGGSKLLRWLLVPLDGELLEHPEKALEPSSLLEQLLLLLPAPV